MTYNLYWILGGGCDGDSMSLLNIDSPDFTEMMRMLDINVLWHPSFSSITVEEYRRQIDGILSGNIRLDILCVEGAVIRGPGGTGMYDTLDGHPKKDLISALAHKSGHVIAVGTCASFGGIGADGDIEATGLQFHKKEKGGFLGGSFRSGSGLPVINLPGCPCHCNVVLGAVSGLLNGNELPFDEFQRPLYWYGTLIHQGCTRNEYHEYRVEETEFGEKGCLFFYMGCQGPLAQGPCNKFLWNRRSSKTRVGIPCFGCTNPDFPQPYPFFKTRNIEGIPIELPMGMSRAHYLAYKSMAAAAAPSRLKDRKTPV